MVRASITDRTGAHLQPACSTRRAHVRAGLHRSSVLYEVCLQQFRIVCVAKAYNIIKM